MLQQLNLFRSVWFSGRYGGGKTLAAVYTAVQLVNQGKVTKVISNIPLNLGVESVQVDNKTVQNTKDAAILIDEAWTVLATGMWKEARDWFAFLRKRNQYLLLPSVLPLTGITRTYRIERRWAGSQLGIDLWWYNWIIDYGELSVKGSERGRWLLRYPSRVYNLYDHGSEPDEFRLYDFSRVGDGQDQLRGPG